MTRNSTKFARKFRKLPPIFAREIFLQSRATSANSAITSPFALRRRHSESRLRVEVVAIAGKHRKARTLDAHFNAVIRLRTIGLSGRVGKCVLIAGLLGDARIKPFQIIAARRVENISASRVRIFRENAVSKESDAAI